MMNKSTQPVVNDADAPEFVGQIIDIFEDFLDARGVVLKNEERDTDEDLDPEEAANIYGDDYDELKDALAKMMSRWGVLRGTEDIT